MNPGDEASSLIPLADIMRAANKLVAANLIQDWALGGALAAIYYVEPFATYDADSSGHGTDDLDLFVYDAGGVLVGSSAGATAEERVQLMAPAPGDYTACIHGFAPNGDSSTFTLSSWVVAPNVGTPALKVRGLPTHVEPGDTTKVRLSWSGAIPGTRYLGGLRLVQGADADTGTTLGVTLLSVEPGVLQGIRGLTDPRKSARPASTRVSAARMPFLTPPPA